MRTHLSCLFVSLIFGFPAQNAAAQSGASGPPEANPGRPTVSTPATLTPVGCLQFETGTLGAFHSPEFAARGGFNEVLKFSVTSRVEILAAVEPIARATAEGISMSGPADAFVGAQVLARRGEGANPTVAVSYFHRIYDGGIPELDFGSPVNSFLILASADVKGFHYDANALFNELSQGSVRRAQFGQTLSVSHSIWKLTVSGEIWHFSQPFLRGNAVGNLWAASYPVRKNLVVDGGFNHGLTGTSTRWEVFAGFTYLLPHRLLNRRAARP